MPATIVFQFRSHCHTQDFVQLHLCRLLSAMDILSARSAQVRGDGVYLGLLEWVVFSVLERMTVLILFGEYVLNVGQVFAPALCHCP